MSGTSKQPTVSLANLLLLMVVDMPVSAVANVECNSPQFLELSSKGVVKCLFPETFYGVYWYNKTDVTASDLPIVSLTDGVGRGGTKLYPAGEFDIFPNGSMIIMSVTDVHDHTFGVALVEDKDQPHVFKQTQVRVFARPDEPYPTIHGCEVNNTCYIEVSKSSNITCRVSDVRPSMEISWALRSKEGYDVLSSTTDSSATITVPLNDSLSALELFVCNASSQIPLIQSSHTEILVENIGLELAKEYILMPTKLGDRLILGCSEEPVLSLVWKMNSTILATGITNSANEWIVTNYEVTSMLEGTTLVINEFQESAAGRYMCVYSDGYRSDYVLYRVSFEGSQSSAWIVIIVVLFLLIVIAVLGCIVKRRHGCSPYNGVSTENDPEGASRQTNLAKVTEKPPAKKPPAKLSPDEVKEMCSKDVNFKVPESGSCPYKTHKENVALLRMAEDSKVDVNFINIKDCFKSIDGSAKSIVLDSGTNVPIVKTTGVMLLKSSKQRKISEDGFKLILRYASTCDSMTLLSVDGFLLPQSIDVNELHVRSDLKVEWVTNTTAGTVELKSGKWMHKEGGVLEEEVYKKLLYDAEANDVPTVKIT